MYITSGIRFKPALFLRTHLLWIAVLCGICGTARAQIYVANNSIDTVGEFDVTTGTAINPTLVSGVEFPTGVAVYGNNLFVTNLVLNHGQNGPLVEYNATTGAVINAHLIPLYKSGPEAGLEAASSIALSGNKLYVAYGLGNNNIIGIFDANTGAAIKAKLIETGRMVPICMAATGSVLFAGFNANDTVAEYNADTGAPIKVPFIGGLAPAALAIWNGDIYVSHDNEVDVYDVSSGAPVALPLITTGGVGIAFSGSNLYLASDVGLSDGEGIGEFNAVTGGTDNLVFFSETGFPVAIAVAQPAIPQPRAGKYTLLLASTGAGADIPQGTGYATMTITSKGGVVFSGKLADNESFSTSGAVVTIGTDSGYVIGKALSYPSVSTRGEKGLLSGTLAFVAETGTSDINGTLQWDKPQQKKGSYPAAFDTSLDVIGSLYAPPSHGSSILPGFVSGTLQLSDTGTLSISDTTQLDQTIALSTHNVFQLVAPVSDKLKISIKSANGVFSGSFLYPGDKTRTDFSGVLFQDQTIGCGFFLGPDGSGTVSLTPAP